MNRIESILLSVIAMSSPAFANEAAETFPASTVPVSAGAYEKRIAEEREVAVSVIPGEGYASSSIPVGNPRCNPGSNCPEPLHGGRVRFWFVGLDLNRTHGCKKSGCETANGAGFSGGVFFMRRLRHGFYEVRNLVSLEATAGEVDTTSLGLRTHLENSAYFSTFGDNVLRNPFTLILGGKLVEQTTYRAGLPRTQVLTGAVQLSSGVVISTEHLNNKLTVEMDILRTAVGMFDKDELGPDTEQKARVLYAKPPRSWGISETFVSRPAALFFEVGKANFEGPLNESILRVNLDGYLRLADLGMPPNSATYSGFYLNLSGGATRYEADLPTGDVRQIDWNAQLGFGFKSWPVGASGAKR